MFFQEYVDPDDENKSNTNVQKKIKKIKKDKEIILPEPNIIKRRVINSINEIEV